MPNINLPEMPPVAWIGLAVALTLIAAYLLRPKARKRPTPRPAIEPTPIPQPVQSRTNQFLALESQIETDSRAGLPTLANLYSYILKLHDIHAQPNRQVELKPDHLHFTLEDPHTTATIRIVDGAYQLTTGTPGHTTTHADAQSLIWDDVYGSGRPSLRPTAG